MAEKEFEITGAEAVLKKFRLLEVGFKNAVESAVLAGCKQIEADAKLTVVRDTSRLARSITSGLTKLFPDVIGIVGANTVYAEVVEKGRRPGKTPPPVSAIKKWLKRVGGDPNAAFVIARSIGEKGVKARPFLAPAVQKNKGKISQMITAAMKKTINDAKEETK